MNAAQRTALALGLALGFLAGIIACASVPTDQPAPTRLTVRNDNFEDAVVYAIPCGQEACKQRLGTATGKASTRLSYRVHHLSPTGQLVLAYRYIARQGLWLVDPVTIPEESDAVLYLASTRGSSFAYPQVRR